MTQFDSNLAVLYLSSQKFPSLFLSSQQYFNFYLYFLNNFLLYVIDFHKIIFQLIFKMTSTSIEDISSRLSKEHYRYRFTRQREVLKEMSKLHTTATISMLNFPKSSFMLGKKQSKIAHNPSSLGFTAKTWDRSQ